MNTNDRHYLAIAEFYGSRTAARSGVLLIRHIDEGLRILDAIGADLDAKQAFCIHPLLQADADLKTSLLPGSIFSKYDPDTNVVVLAMEYRRVANAYLSDRCVSENDVFELSPLPSVNQMLIADKVQNRNDFEIYHSLTHERAATLALYFRNWLLKLGISEEQYHLLCAKGKAS